MVHVFCDESGGTAPAEQYLALAAVALEQDTAAHVVKAFRKAAKIRDPEIKGHRLTAEQRTLFVRILIDRGGLRGAAVVCARGAPIADWAMGNAQQHGAHVLYRHMLEEGVGLLRLDGTTRGLTIDKGRYKRSILDQIAADLGVKVQQLAGRPLPLAYADSAGTPGIQIADVICNTAGRLFTHNHAEDSAQQVLEPLLRDGLLIVRPAQLPNLAPAWVRQQAEYVA